MDEDYIGVSILVEFFCGVFCGVGGIVCGFCIFFVKFLFKVMEIWFILKWV